jgi:hypothetical protein
MCRHHHALAPGAALEGWGPLAGSSCRVQRPREAPPGGGGSPRLAACKAGCAVRRGGCSLTLQWSWLGGVCRPDCLDDEALPSASHEERSALARVRLEGRFLELLLDFFYRPERAADLPGSMRLGDAVASEKPGVRDPVSGGLHAVRVGTFLGMPTWPRARCVRAHRSS